MTADTNVLLSCHDLTKRFGGVVALNKLQLDIRQNEVLGVIGPNGSGKTTFFNVITGILKPTAGWIRFDGELVSGWTSQRLHRKGIARTFQRSRLCLDLSIFDNLMIGAHTGLSQTLWANLVDRRILRREVEAQRVVARELLDAFSPTLAGRLDDLVGALPMIDRRRIEICRALISRPRLLLLDEPSAGMTESETRELMQNVMDLKAGLDGLTVVLIEHEMAVIERITDRCVVINFGQKICEGAYAEVVSDPLVQEAYLGSGLESAA